jgi:GNAT superfamily N-acetyltransferase
VTRAVVDVKRAKSPAVRVRVARDEGVDCGVFTSWDGVDRMGMVEDLFVLPEHRGRGVARALVRRAVADARERGAQSVLSGALVDDTPKDLYRRMGFDPLVVRRCWTSPLRP